MLLLNRFCRGPLTSDGQSHLAVVCRTRARPTGSATRNKKATSCAECQVYRNAVQSEKRDGDGDGDDDDDEDIFRFGFGEFLRQTDGHVTLSIVKRRGTRNETSWKRRRACNQFSERSLAHTITIRDDDVILSQ